MSEIRVSEIRVSEIRISSNHRELHGAIFSQNGSGSHVNNGFVNGDLFVKKSEPPSSPTASPAPLTYTDLALAKILNVSVLCYVQETKAVFILVTRDRSYDVGVKI